MNKLLIIVIFIILFCIVWLGTYRLLDGDGTLQLPFSQGVASIENTFVLGKPYLHISHVVVIIMENESEANIVGNSEAPFINSLIKKYSFADNYFAITHPSLPNYISILGGDTFGITSDCTDCTVSSVNLIDQLEKNHKTWKAYMEDMPTRCFVGDSGNYAQKHNPFIYFDDIRNNSKKCQKIVPLTSLQQDIVSPNAFANFVWITPNLCHDMHNCSISVGDSWLSTEVPLLLNSPAFTKEKSLLVITWDEGKTSGNNKIPTLFLGNIVKKGYISHTVYSHYSLTHTIEDVWNLPPLTNNITQSAITRDIFTSPIP